MAIKNLQKLVGAGTINGDLIEDPPTFEFMEFGATAPTPAARAREFLQIEGSHDYHANHAP